ncbi:hypothetical protein SteCoe_859 [Stentor coeruleus]|uniref:Trichohyalin-plectin-homology domain-containing protein n=1 Tax=Stentor coeruleus TaxID=5963 RepID=A0A1R2D2X7_9CILI|nr:hypothetical protein SteCoe_859 [Stentor coeruleus]
MFKKPQDEWGLVVQKQAELNSQQEFKEKQRRLEEKERYHQELEQQAYYHQQKLKEEKRIKDSEGFLIKEQVKAFQQEENRKKQLNSEFQKNLAEEYLTHASYLKNRQTEEIQSKLREEQKQLEIAKALLEQERLKKLQLKEKLHQDNIEMLNYKSYKEQEKKREAQEVTRQDLELMRIKKETEEKKEQDYRNYYEKVQQNQMMKQRLYAEQVGAKLVGKESDLTSWVGKNVENYNRNLTEKEMYERRVKQANIENIKETLKSQIEEKNRIEQQRLEEKRRNTEEMNRIVEENRRKEEERQRIRKMQQADYFKNLSTQAAEVQDIRNSTYKMSELEKKLNKNLPLDQSLVRNNNFSLGAQEILKPKQRSSSIFGTPNEPNTQVSRPKQNSVGTFLGPRPIENSPVINNRSNYRPAGLF